jgi:hypothetical protein
MKNSGLLIAAIIVLFVGSVALILIKPNIKEDNARYLLSAIPQVIGTVFVLTVAIMQAFGGSEFFDIKKLTSQPEFKVTGTVSFFGMTVPLIVLYFNLFCIGPAVSLCLFVSNLLVIAWFIFSIAPEQAAGKSLSKLKKEVLEILRLGVPLDAIPYIVEMAEIGKSHIKKDIQTTRYACSAVKDVTLDSVNRFPEIWNKSIELLIDMDKELRKNNKIAYSEEFTIHDMRDLSVRSKFKETKGWLKIKDYLFELFRDDIQNGKLDFDKPAKPDKLDAFMAIKDLIKWINQEQRFELSEELRDSLIKEIKDAMKHEGLRQKYKMPAFVFIFNAIVQSFLVKSLELSPDTKTKLETELSEFANIVKEPLKDLFSEEAKALIPKYLVYPFDTKSLVEKFDEVKKGFTTKR